MIQAQRVAPCLTHRKHSVSSSVIILFNDHKIAGSKILRFAFSKWESRLIIIKRSFLPKTTDIIVEKAGPESECKMLCKNLPHLLPRTAN